MTKRLTIVTAKENWRQWRNGSPGGGGGGSASPKGMVFEPFNLKLGIDFDHFGHANKAWFLHSDLELSMHDSFFL